MRYFTRKAKSAVLLAVLAVAAYFLSGWLTTASLAYAPVEATPFTLQIRNVSYENDPEGQLISIRTIARRQDGSEALLAYYPGQPEAGVLRRVTSSGGKLAVISDLVKGRVSGFLSAEQTARKKARLRNPPDNCASEGEKHDGVEQVAGVDAHRVTAERPNGDRYIAWRVAELGCEAIQYVNEVRQPDGTFRAQVRLEPVYLRKGAPDEFLFDAASGHEEMAPSELRQAMMSAAGMDPDPECAECRDAAARADAAYERHQQAPPDAK